MSTDGWCMKMHLSIRKMQTKWRNLRLKLYMNYFQGYFMRRQSVPTFLLLIILCTGPLLADTIYLSNGKRVDGKIENQSATDVFIRTPQGLRKVPKRSIRRIEYGDAAAKREELRRQAELKRLQEQRRQQLEEQKRLEEQRRKEEAERTRLEEERKRKELEEQKKEDQRKKKSVYRQNDINFRGGLGLQHLKPGILGLRNAIIVVGAEFGGGFADRKDRSAELAPMLSLGIGYNYGRFFLDLDASVSESRSSGRTAGTENSGGLTSAYQSAELHDPIRNSMIELALRADVYERNHVRIRPFVGIRRHMVETETMSRTFGIFPGLPYTMWRQTVTDAGSTTEGVIGGLEVLMPYRIGRTYVGLSFLFGYASGKGDGFFQDEKIAYASYGKVAVDSVRHYGDISVKGPYVGLRGTYLINERLSLVGGFRYEIYRYQFTTFDLSNNYEQDLSSLIRTRAEIAGMSGYITERSQTVEMIKTLDFAATYRLPIR